MPSQFHRKKVSLLCIQPVHKKISSIDPTHSPMIHPYIQELNDGLWEWNHKTKEFVCTQGIYKNMGYSFPPEVPDLERWKSMLSESALLKLKNKFLQILQDKNNTFALEINIQTPKGVNKWLSCRGNVVSRNEKGNAERIIGICSDITPWKESEMLLENKLSVQKDQIEKLEDSLVKIKAINNQLVLAKELAEENDKQKSAFLANMSHEIRNPLNGIVGFANLLADPDLSSESFRQYVEFINWGSKQLLTVVDDIIDISKIEAGQLKIHLEETHLNELILELYALHATLKDESDVMLSFSVDFKDKDDVIIMDRTRLRQVLNNLLINAFKFTQSGEICFGYRLHNNMIEFKVSDTGIGIDPKYHQIIFERFKQVENFNFPQSGGTGLGLAISKAIVNLLGGTIQVHSELNQGTTFTFTIPYRKKSGNISTKEPIQESLSELSLQERTILIVEDEEINFQYMQDLLSVNGLHILRASNGAEAVEICSQNENIELVLMDIKMPLMDGYQATKEIKKARAGLPVIAQTAYAMIEDKIKAKEAGCDDYLSKPIARTQLFHMLNHYLQTNPKAM